MINPLAFIMVALGAMLVRFGLFLVLKRRKNVGTLISLLGLGFCAVPFLISFIIFHTPDRRRTLKRNRLKANKRLRFQPILCPAGK